MSRHLRLNQCLLCLVLFMVFVGCSPSSDGAGFAGCSSGSGAEEADDTQAAPAQQQLEPGEEVESGEVPAANVEAATQVALLVENAVQIHTVGGEQAVLETTIDFEQQPSSIAWLDANRLAIMVEEKLPSEPGRRSDYNHELFIYQDGELEAVELPEAQAWKLEPPAAEPSHWKGGVLLAAPDDELWIRRCASFYTGDADPCAAYSYVRILPSVIEKRSDSPLEAAEEDAPDFAEPPEDTQVDVDAKFENADRPDMMISATITCRSGSDESATWQASPPHDDFLPGEKVIWLSVEPPIYGVSEYDESGEAHRNVYLLFKACDERPLANVEASEFVFHSDEWWAVNGWDPTEKTVMWVVIHRDRVVGEFKPAPVPRRAGPSLALRPDK